MGSDDARPLARYRLPVKIDGAAHVLLVVAHDEADARLQLELAWRRRVLGIETTEGGSSLRIEWRDVAELEFGPAVMVESYAPQPKQGSSGRS